MKNIIFFTLFLGCFMNLEASFIDEQKKFERVKTAFSQKEESILKNLRKNDIKKDELNIMFIAFKSEDILELWAKNKNDENYKLIKEYKICSKSGVLGPKTMQGDYQVPEGFYYINRFNPASSYHLSLGLNYPNLADKKRSNGKNLGGDIFIHGKCVTIGCLPMKDEQIKEIYIYAILAKNFGQNKIPIYIFPFKMSDENIKKYNSFYKNDYLKKFWQNLKIGHDIFYKTYKELNYKYKDFGLYEF